MHGWGISLRIQAVSNEVLQVNQGSLYPALHRLEQQGLIASNGAHPKTTVRRSSTSSPRAGRKQLTEETTNWERLLGAVARILAS